MNKFFVGLILGIALAGGLAVYLNNTPMQFVLKGVNHTPNNVTTNSSGPMILAPGTKLQVAKASNAYTSKELASQPDNANASAPNYEFYDILQGESASATNKATPSPTPIQQQVLEFMVQAGAFTTADAANDMQARIALLGISSVIKTDQNKNNKIINRVLIGPISTESEAEQIINRLSDEQINAVLLRITD